MIKEFNLKFIAQMNTYERMWERSIGIFTKIFQFPAIKITEKKV